METSEVKEYLIDFQKNKLPELVKRNLKISSSKKIKSIIGPRRAGKTYFMYQKIRDFIEKGIKKENILYLNLEDPRLIEIDFKDIKKIIKLHWEIYPDSMDKDMYIFIDEPQNIKKWEVAVRSLHDEGFYVFLSGSSSKLLSKEIATSLRGRTLSYTILPFSFKEFLKTKEVKFDLFKLSSKEKSKLLNFLNEFLEFGGFPEIVLEKNKEGKIKTLKEYLDLVVYKDIVERYNIKNTNLIKWLIKSLMGSFSKEFSVHKLYNTIKSKGMKLSKNTLYSYLSMLEEALFVFFLEKFDYSIRKKELSINKVYLCDIGFSKLTSVGKEKGKKMENVMFLELKRKEKPNIDLFYYKSRDGHEVDFVVKKNGNVEKLIQVCYDVDNIDTKKREVRGLIHASKELKCRNLIVITYDHDNTEEVEWYGTKRKIKFIPLWKFLLEK